MTETGGTLLEQPDGMGYPAVVKQAYSTINYSLLDFDSTYECPSDSPFVCPHQFLIKGVEPENIVARI